ncbi:S-adenosyl-L-methionine-dependent methyltransferase [Chaetomium tenue]|uniref:S-adenosyl-L-methionine-dependent methyltransferase n=1 Tax=Chaetomium tenue TaxID=1854479 RepID=A0ACB7NXT8_9PEZI|nr:S-adenosyl-L-methionine-dependent methyltransferase [Chaetomium globosum]
MSSLFCCSSVKPYRPQVLQHERKFMVFMAWAEFPQQSSPSTDDGAEKTDLIALRPPYAIQLVRQVNFGPLESKRYFIPAEGNENEFAEVVEDDLIQANFKKLNSNNPLWRVQVISAIQLPLLAGSHLTLPISTLLAVRHSPKHLPNTMLSRGAVPALPLRSGLQTTARARSFFAVTRRFSTQRGPRKLLPVTATESLGNSYRFTARLPVSPGPTQFQSTMTTAPPKTSANDWSPDQYLLFRDARNRPIHDLLHFLGPDYSPTSIIDLGCGPGNSTELLTTRFPSASITGVDSSPAMLTKARTTLPTTAFTLADLHTYTPPPHTDLLFSNAVFHWLRHADRLPTLTRLLRTQQPGRGVLAFQVPDNHAEPSHRAMRETAAAPGPWQPYFAKLTGGERPDLDPIESPLVYYDALKPLCRMVETWTTRYVHVLGEGHAGIVEWVRGTGLQPFLGALPGEGEGGAREGFLEEYRRRLEREYPVTKDGCVLLEYPRRFVVAFR